MPTAPPSRRSWETRCEKAGVQPVTIHDARRARATLLDDLDVHPRVAAQVLRHARSSVTMEIHTQVSTKVTRDALKRLGDSRAEAEHLYFTAARQQKATSGCRHRPVNRRLAAASA